MTNQQLGGPQTEEILYEDLDSPLGESIPSEDVVPGSVGDTENVTIYGGDGASLGHDNQYADETNWQQQQEQQQPAIPQLDYIPPAAPQISPVEHQLHETLMTERRAAMNERLNRSVNEETAQVADAYYQHLITNEGYDRQQATDMVESQGHIYRQALVQKISQHIQGQQLNNQAKVFVAQKIASGFGINPETLMMFDSPEKMYQGAVQFSQGVRGAAEENQRLRQENQYIRSRRVPVQKYDRGGRPRGAANNDQLIDQYNNGVENEQTLAAVKRRYGI